MRHSWRAWVLRVAIISTSLGLLELVTIRFTGQWLALNWAWLNSILIVLIGLSVPVLAWILLADLRINWLRISIRSILIVVMPIYVLGLAAPAIRYHSWVVVAELEAGGSRYRAYRRPYYLYDSAIELRHEVPLLLGLQLRSGPNSSNYSDRSDLKLRDDGRVEASIHHYPDGKPRNYVFPR